MSVTLDYSASYSLDFAATRRERGRAWLLPIPMHLISSCPAAGRPHRPATAASRERNSVKLTRPVSCESEPSDQPRSHRDQRAPREERGATPGERRTIHQSGLKLGDADRARAVRVDGGEPLPELRVCPWGRPDGRRGPPVRRLRGRRAVPVRRGRAVLGAGGTLLVGNAGRALAVVRGLGGVSLRAAVVEGHQIARGVD